MLKRTCSLVVCMALALAFGCSSDTGSAAATNNQMMGPNSTQRTDAGTQPNPTQMNQGQGVYRLMIIGETQVAALTGSRLRLQVAYEQDGRPLSGQTVEFEMLDAQNRVASRANGVDGSRLESWSTQTNPSGVASVNAILGNVESNFKVRAKAANAAPVEWMVTVRSAGIGSFQVILNYAAMGQRYTYASLTRAKVYLFNQQTNRITCDTLAREPGTIAGSDSLYDLEPFNAMDNKRNVENLAAGTTWTIAGVAFDQANATVAFGCAEGQIVEGGAQTNVEIALSDLPLQFKGIFTVRHKLNIRAALNQPDAMGDINSDCDGDNAELCRLNQALSILQLLGGMEGDRQQAFEDLFCRIIDIDGTVCTLVSSFVTAGLLGPILDTILPEQAPALYVIFQALADVVKILEEFTVIGQMEFIESTPDMNGRLPNNDDRWTKFEYTWRPGSEGVANGMCIPGRDCIKLLPLEEAHGDNCPPGLTREQRAMMGCLGNRNDRRTVAIQSPFDAVVNGSTLEIKEHTLNVRYGLLALNIVQYWLLPQILARNAPVTLEAVVRDLLDNQNGNGDSVCTAINEQLRDPAFCEDVLVPTLANLLAGLLYELTISDDRLTLRGTVAPLDTDGDLVIDTLSGGVWNGRIGDNGMFPGCFNGCRGSDCTPADCTIPNQ